MPVQSHMLLKPWYLCSLLALSAWVPINADAQEALPSLDGSFLTPQATPLGDKVFESESNNLPDVDMAGKNTGSLNNLFSHQWVHTTADSRLKGSVVTLVGQDTLTVSGIKVVLAQQGRVIATVQSESDGEFVFENVAPGYYSIIAAAENSFATYGLAVMNDVSGSHLPGSIELRVIRPKSDDIRRILNVDTVPSRDLAIDDRSVRDPISSKRVFAKSHRVMSTKDGKVIGHLSRLGMAPELVDMSEMKAMLLKDGQVIARSEVTKNGAFEFEGVEPGCYGFAAAGNKGVAAVAFCVVKPESFTQRKSSDGKVFVAAVADMVAAPELNVELADTADVMSIQDTGEVVKPDQEEIAVDEELPIAQPMMPYGGSNMFGAGQVISGGGGSPLGGALSNLAPLVGLGAIAYAIHKNNDDDNTIVSPIVRR